MCSGIAFFFGLFLLFRGQLIINNRIIPPNKTRMIALILMAPLAIGLIAGALLFSPSGVLDFDTLQNAALIEFLALVGAVVAVYYIISTTPPSGTLPMQHMPPFAPPSVTPHVPDILTVPEAAAYLRVSEAEVMRLIDEGKLPAARIGDSFRIARIAIEDFLQQQR
jgi:excisionase family DNA binding protein